MKKSLLGLGVILLLTTSCGLFDIQLTDDLVKSYIAAQSQVMKLGKSGKSPSAEEMDKIVKAAGFSDMGQFMKVSAKVGMLIGRLQTDEYTKKMNELTSPESAQWEEMMKNPDLSEDAKKEVRMQMEKASKEFKKQKEQFADPILGILDQFTDKTSLEVVKRHEKALMAVYTNVGAQ